MKDKRVELFMSFGLCGACGRTYRIKNAHTFLFNEVRDIDRWGLGLVVLIVLVFRFEDGGGTATP